MTYSHDETKKEVLVLVNLYLINYYNETLKVSNINTTIPLASKELR